MNYTCPVCGFALPYAAEAFHICPCCGTEFGYDDARRLHSDLRAQWLRNGARWWSPVGLPPDNWDPFRQVSLLLERAQQFVPIGYTLRSLIDPVSGNQNAPNDILRGEMHRQSEQSMGRGIMRSAA